MQPVQQKWLVQVSELAVLGKPQPEVKIFGGWELRAISSGSLQSVAAHHYRWMPQTTIFQERLGDGMRGLWQRARLAGQFAPFVDEADLRSDHVDLGMCCKKVILQLQAISQSDVVRIHAPDQRCRRSGYAVIERIDQTFATIGYNANPLVSLGQLREQCTRAIS